MKTKRILLAIVCLLVILGCLNYLLQQSPMPIGTPGRASYHSAEICHYAANHSLYLWSGSSEYGSKILQGPNA